eukprot:CAMPEP_0118975222 /NCGR_PEP_ID=MMETSP1173-20130426/14985_1 /TAXON_ID=1034831 /ORGANISM="Rhizochromulina marina cf, Strain CCMP1243" /LENGTH=38 /DNA_ID= /DNA_START= /DNA_END= /DNA_ORIENTATION=
MIGMTSDARVLGRGAKGRAVVRWLIAHYRSLLGSPATD